MSEHDHRIIERLRRGLLLIASATVVGTITELASRKHWTQPVQLVAWASVLLLVVAIALAWRSADPAVTRAVRIIAAVVMVAAAFGVIEHIIGNYDAGPLDAVYGEQWDSMSELSRWWTAAIQAVGPSPALAPGVLVISSLCVLLASRARPSHAAAPEPSAEGVSSR